MSDSYYGRPIVKPHVWTPYVPLYFWIGGTAGAASVQMLAAQLRGDTALARVQKRIALAGAAIAPVLLIADLGVPKRFLNMLRVLKPTSPMSLGSWVLTAFATAIGAATAAELFGLERAARAAEVAAATAGPALATYTAVLLADTATPVWHDARFDLPFVFVASAVAGAGAVGVVFAPLTSLALPRRFMIGGALAIVAATGAMERRLGSVLAEPYRNGRAGALQRASTFCAFAGATLGLIAGRGRARNHLAAALVIASGLCERYAVFAAGKQSALDPKYTVAPQRARLTEREAANAA